MDVWLAVKAVPSVGSFARFIRDAVETQQVPDVGRRRQGENDLIAGRADNT
jgi:hypothetical protein